jgi:hypothetical protein
MTQQADPSALVREPDLQFKVTQRSSGKPSRANAMGQWLVAACNLQHCSGLSGRLPTLEQAP